MDQYRVRLLQLPLDTLVPQVHHHDRGQSAQSSFSEYREGVHGMSKNFCNEGEVQKKISEHQSKQALHDILSEVGVEPSADKKGQDSSEDEDMGFEAMAPVASRHSADRIPPGSSQPPQQPISPKRRGRGPNGAAGTTSLLREAAPEAMGPPPPAKPAARTRGKGKGKESGLGAPSAAAMQSHTKSEKLFEDKKLQFSDANLWQGGLKRRAVQTAIKQLDDAAQKLVGVPEWADLVSSIKDFNDGLLQKYDLLANIKKDMYFTTALPEDQSDLLTNFSPHLVAQILVHAVNQWLKEIDHQDPLFLVL